MITFDKKKIGVNSQRVYLRNYRSYSCPPHAHGRQAQPAENQNWVKHDIQYIGLQQDHHRCFGIAHAAVTIADRVQQYHE